MRSNASEPVVLRGGLTVPAGALYIAWDFENRGITIQLDQDGTLLVGPRGQLTDADREAIRRYRADLVQLVRYAPDDSHLFTDIGEKRTTREPGVTSVQQV